MAVSEVVARPVRTALQLGAGTGIAAAVDAFHDLTGEQQTAVAFVVTLVLSMVQAAVENKTGKALLRNVPPRDVPVVDDAPPA